MLQTSAGLCVMDPGGNRGWREEVVRVVSPTMNNSTAGTMALGRRNSFFTFLTIFTEEKFI